MRKVGGRDRKIEKQIRQNDWFSAPQNLQQNVEGERRKVGSQRIKVSILGFVHPRIRSEMQKEKIGKQRIKVNHFGFSATWSPLRNAEGKRWKEKSEM